MIYQNELIRDEDGLRLECIRSFDEDQGGVEPVDFTVSLLREIYKVDRLDVEHGFIATYDFNDCLQTIHQLSIGDRTYNIFYHRNVMAYILLAEPQILRIFHNHPMPYGDLNFSDSDINVHNLISEYSKGVGIIYKGSTVITRNGYVEYGKEPVMFEY